MYLFRDDERQTRSLSAQRPATQACLTAWPSLQGPALRGRLLVQRGWEQHSHWLLVEG